VISVKGAHHFGDYPVDIEFNGGASGVVEVRD